MILTSLARFCLEHDIQGERDDELYVEALRVLGASIGEHRVDVGGLQILFWSDHPEGDAFLGGALGAVADHWRHHSSPAVRAWLDGLHAGRLGGDLPAAGIFHVLGLSHGEAAPVIGFWITDTFVGLADRVRAFWEDLRFAAPGQLSAAAILDMMQEAALARDYEQIAPRLTQDLLAAMLTGSDFPPRLLLAVVDGIRRDGEVDGRRAAVLKALLARRARLSGGARPAPAQFDPQASDPAYRFGRLFAVFDAIWALGGSSAKPSVRFRNLAAASPRMTALAFGGLARVRLAAARAKGSSRRLMLRQELDRLLSSVEHQLPGSLTVENQARFALGLFQQRQALALSE